MNQSRSPLGEVSWDNISLGKHITLIFPLRATLRPKQNTPLQSYRGAVDGTK